MGQVITVAFNNDGSRMASASSDGTARLWETSSGRELHKLPSGEGPLNEVWGVAFSPDGTILASGGRGGVISLWESSTGSSLHSFKGDAGSVWALAYDRVLATSQRNEILLWQVPGGHRLRTLHGHQSLIAGLAFAPGGETLASASDDGTVRLWNVSDGTWQSLSGHAGGVNGVAFHPAGEFLVSGGNDRSIKVWDRATGKLSISLEGHTGPVEDVAFSVDGALLASKAADHTIRLWDSQTWRTVAIIQEPASFRWLTNLAFHPRLPLLASVSKGNIVHLWKLDVDVLLGRHPALEVAAAPPTAYTSAKLLLVGDSGVGKTGLGWRLTHGDFKEHISTHGQQFWLMNDLCQTRKDGAQCEAVLWDLAGQPDYRLTHALFLDEADLVLLLFDPTRPDDPLSGVEYWLRQLHGGPEKTRCPVILIAARSDRGLGRLTHAELDEFCTRQGISGWLSTSAVTGEGVNDLTGRMKTLIAWDDKPATVTTETFKRIKDHVLELKEDRGRQRLIFTPQELHALLTKTSPDWKVSEAEILAATGHLATHGYVAKLRTSQGEPRLLLSPEMLNNLAASFVLEARRNQGGLGTLEEGRLLTGGYNFQELDKLDAAERPILLDSAVTLFLARHVCFRETDPLTTKAYLVFPGLINLKRPAEEAGRGGDDGVSYTVTGAVENLYASLVVLMGYTPTFTRTNQWRNEARYTVGSDGICGFRLEREDAGQLEFVLYFGRSTGESVQTLFQGLFESFLLRPRIIARRLELVVCPKGHVITREAVLKRMAEGAAFIHCSNCGRKTKLPKAGELQGSSGENNKQVGDNQAAAARRSRFEQVLLRLKTHATERGITFPECFISYAWGNEDQERWVQRELATDLQKAGIRVVLDRWDNAAIGGHVPSFVARILKCDYVAVVGTPAYFAKFESGESMRPAIVAAEGDLIGARMIGPKSKKSSVLPLLLEGEPDTSLPTLLQGWTYGDFRKPEAYFTTALDLLLTLYKMNPQDPMTLDLRDSLQDRLRR